MLRRESKHSRNRRLYGSALTATVQITDWPYGHILTNCNVWSPDGKWIVYDTRSDPAGDRFDGDTIEIVHVETREVRELYRSQNGAHCGVATFSTHDQCVVFILGPENPTEDWQYGPAHRQGVLVYLDHPQVAIPLDARDLTPPFTPGALRGGSHVHVFDSRASHISFTYEDHVLARLDADPHAPPHDRNQRNLGVSVLRHPVNVSGKHPRNHNGTAFSALMTRTVNDPRPGSNEISRAFEEAWIGTNGYVRSDGTCQQGTLAFQGHVRTRAGDVISEVFVVDLPNDLTIPGDGPICGTETARPAPPRGVDQRRLTFTADRKFPGLQGPRHWLRSSPDGARIAFLMRDDDGIVQIWTVSPNGGAPTQVTRNAFDVASSFSWNHDGTMIAYVADNSIFVTEIESGTATRLTARMDDTRRPRPEACVFSPDGRRIAYVQPVERDEKMFNQIFVAESSS